MIKSLKDVWDKIQDGTYQAKWSIYSLKQARRYGYIKDFEANFSKANPNDRVCVVSVLTDTKLYKFMCKHPIKVITH